MDEMDEMDEKRRGNLVVRRPAETGTVAIAIALLVGYVLGLDEGAVAALGIVIGGVPGAITWIVEQWRR